MKTSGARAQLSPAVTAAAVLVIAVGVVLRLLGMFTLELWSDEARWCEHLLTGTGTWFRPAGYMWVTRQILEAFEVNEPLLRSLSTVSGIAMLPLVYVALRHLVARPAVAVLGTWWLAIHPVAVAMSKEFKPYAVEAMLHAALIVATLLAVRDEASPVARRAWLAVALVTALVAPWFAWTIVFAYPGVYLVLAVNALLRKERARFVATAVGCVATLATLVGVFLLRLANKTPATEYWGKKYDVFYVADGVLGQIGWFVEKTAELASFPAHLNAPWGASGMLALRILSGALFLLGAAAIVAQRRWRMAALLLLPWVPLLAFNAAGAWPYGLFRTNTFLLLYTLVIMVVGVDALGGLLARAAHKRPWLTPTVAAIGVLATFPWQLDAFAHKGPGTLTSEASVLAMLQRVYREETGLAFDAPISDEELAERVWRGDQVRRRLEGDLRNASDEPLPDELGVARPLLVLDGHACMAMRYYRDYDADSRKVLEDWLPSHFDILCGSYGLRGWKKLLHTLRGREFWLIAASTKWPPTTRDHLAPFCDLVVDEFTWPSTHLVRCRRAEGVLPPDSELADIEARARRRQTAAAAVAAPVSGDNERDLDAREEREGREEP